MDYVPRQARIAGLLGIHHSVDHRLGRCYAGADGFLFGGRYSRLLFLREH
jgi:hypothetical protein